MESFRSERQKKHASTQVVITLFILLASIVLLRMLPGRTNPGPNDHQQPRWETSVVNLK